MAAQHSYFWSYAFAGPEACTGDDCLAMDRLLAKMTDDQLGIVMRSDYFWVQTEGKLSATPEDGIYQFTITGDLTVIIEVWNC